MWSHTIPFKQMGKAFIILILLISFHLSSNAEKRSAPNSYKIFSFLENP